MALLRLRDQRIPLLLFVLCFSIVSQESATEVCSNTILPGLKGDDGAVGLEGDEGKQGKTGPPGHQGLTGELGRKGEDGQTGKMGPAGSRGCKGDPGAVGPPGGKGKAGTTCDCGRYRKVVGQMDININKLKNAIKFLKNVILGIVETKEKLYLMVRDAQKYPEALASCVRRGGTLAMPKDQETNSVLTSYLNQAGLAQVFIGLQTAAAGNGSVGNGGGGSGDLPGTLVYADQSPLQNYTAWAEEEGQPQGGGGGDAVAAADDAAVVANNNSTCVGLSSVGHWSRVACDTSMFYMCEFSMEHSEPITQ
ncbi:collectin-10 [Engraulis encrasicolus]|uniref:collectin-10 n=1 Tax=Engraulis encrasicolus TaxID=184585 RepID=UPI002FD3FFD1